ncbi:hypothetical protein Bca4012_015319 [Brassica carinata]
MYVYTSSVVERPVQVTIRGQHANREMAPRKHNNMRRVSWSTILIVVMMVSLLVLEHVVVPAAAGRVLMEKSGDGREMMSVEKMKSTVDSWFQRLASGPSPRGRGH